MKELTRAERRRAEKNGTGPLAISPTALKKPQHYHVELFVYSHVEGGNFQHSTLFDIVTNDVMLAVSRALGQAEAFNGPPRKEWHVRNVRQHSDATCLEGMEV